MTAAEVEQGVTIDAAEEGDRRGMAGNPVRRAPPAFSAAAAAVPEDADEAL